MDSRSSSSFAERARESRRPAGKARNPASGDGSTRWRYGLLAAALLAAAAIAAAGCGRNAVRASEKEFLADRAMMFDSDGQEAAADEHILSNREGAAGGRGTSGGGCGCN